MPKKVTIELEQNKLIQEIISIDGWLINNGGTFILLNNYLASKSLTTKPNNCLKEK